MYYTGAGKYLVKEVATPPEHPEKEELWYLGREGYSKRDEIDGDLKFYSFFTVEQAVEKIKYCKRNLKLSMCYNWDFQFSVVDIEGNEVKN